MATPTTYAEWTNLLEKFCKGDDAAIEEMDKGSFTIDSGTASRFYMRVNEAYKTRKQSWLDKFQRSFEIENFKTEDDFSIALRNGKQNLLPLIRFIAIKGLPEDLKKTLKKDLEEFVAEIKKSLKDNASKNSGSNEKMMIMLNDFSLYESIENLPIGNKITLQNSNEITPAMGRKIIF